MNAPPETEFPLVAEAAAQPAAISHPPAATVQGLPSTTHPVLPGRRPRLLVVDDQPVNIQVLYRAFAADHQVLMATSGAQAMALCASQQPDLVLLDVMMPGMDGFEVCRRLKADPATRDTPVIFVTARNDEAAETQGLELGAVDFISKPVNPNIVRARARTHLMLKAQSDLLRRWVYIDGLTGVDNRRHFDERLKIEWSRAVRGNAVLSVILLDVDHFKLYNDLYGHQAGDDCLRQVAAALKESLRRPGDLVARYGGEEFACLLPGCDLAGALMLAGQLLEHVRARALPHAASAVAPVVTVSLGVCSVRAHPSGSPEALLRAADAQLYEAKARGRHRVCGAVLELPAAPAIHPEPAAPALTAAALPPAPGVPPPAATPATDSTPRAGSAGTCKQRSSP